MNELQPLSDLLAKPEPAQAVRDEGRHRLQQAIRTAPAGPRRRPAWLAGALGVTAAAAAVTVMAVSLGSPAPHKAAPNSPQSAQVRLSADTILLAAASNVRKLPSTAAYWRVTTRDVNQVKIPGKDYTLQGGMEREIWISGSPHGKNWNIIQPLGYAPATEADKAAWKADGAPTSWWIKFMDSPKCTKRNHCEREFKSAPEPRSVHLFRKPGTVGNLGDFDITLDQVRALPAEPKGLKAELRRRLPGAKGQELNTILYEAGIGLILELPASSHVRAAAYQMIAALPGVRATGEMSDPLGRRGQSISMGSDGGTEFRYRLIIDPATGLPLATQMYRTKDGTVQSSQIVTRIGWTNDRPALS